jgi:hypothetical protein
MGELFDRIRQAVEADRYVVGLHAHERIRERQMKAWHIIGGLADGRLLAERPDAQPNPTVEVEQALPDGTRVLAVWAWLARSATAKLVTVHYFDR